MHVNNPKYPAVKAIHNLITPWDWGVVDEWSLNPKHRNTKQRVNEWKNFSSYPPAMISLDKIQQHRDGYEIFYFTGNTDSRFVLCMIDIDVDKSGKKGTTAGAHAFARRLNKDPLLKDTPFEPSRGGKGLSGYIVIDREEHCPSKDCNRMGRVQFAKHTNDVERHLQDYLEAIRIHENHDIEKVEIKGQLPSVGKSKWGTADTHCGILAKLPTTIDVRDCPVVRISDIQNLSVQSAAIKESNKTAGSTSGLPFSDQELASIPHRLKTYRPLAQRCLETSGIVQIHSGKYPRNITADHYAVLLTILDLLRNYPTLRNDGAMPGKRVKKVWQLLYQQGRIDKGFDASVFKHLRNVLVDCKVVDMKDNRYHFVQDGKGQAMKWEIREEFTSHYLNTPSLSSLYAVDVDEEPEVKIDYQFQRSRPVLYSLALPQYDHCREDLEFLQSVALSYPSGVQRYDMAL